MRPTIILCLFLGSGCSYRGGEFLQERFSEAQDSWRHGDLPRALDASRSGLRLSQITANPAWAWKFRCIEAEVYNSRRQFQQASSLLSHAVPEEISRSETGVRILVDRGVSFTWMHNFAQAHRCFNDALQLCRLPGNAKPLGELKIRQATLALLESAEPQPRRQYEQLIQTAVALGGEALEIARKNGDGYLEAGALSFHASLLTNMQRWGEAADILAPALELSKRLTIHTLISKISGNLGWCYYNMGDPEAAMQYLKEADLEASKIGQNDDRRLWLTDMGLIYLDRDDFNTAATYHLRALEFARLGNESAPIATCLHNLAITAFNRGDIENARKYSAEEIQMKRLSKGRRASELYARYLEGHLQITQNDPAAAEKTFEEIIADPDATLSLRWQSQVSLARLHMSEKRMDAAKIDFDRAIQDFGQARKQLTRVEFRITFRSGLNRYYSDYINFLMRQGKSVEALQVAELSRGQVLSEGLGLEAHPKLTSAQFAAIARSLDAVILSYWLTPEASYLWVITAQGITPYALPKGAEIWALAESYRKGILSASTAMNPALYKMLVGPAQNSIPLGSRVIVVPDGNLYQLNFETLLVPGEPRPHYWIEDAVISTATSLSLLRRQSAGTRKDNILLIGNADAPNHEFATLPNAGKELHSIAARFPAGRQTLYEGERARPSIYREAKPGDYSWIHFAAHGASSPTESPLDSAIILSNEGDQYKLYARDIAKLPIHADLVTISACYGSGTRTYSGEGIVGLAWAFLQAGAHNVIASLWEANDYYTAQLMDNLYERLRAGDEPARALRSAKMQLLHSEYAGRNPRYWAAFQLYTGY